MVDRFPMMLSFEAASVGGPTGLGDHAGFLSGRLTSSNVGTRVLPNQDSNVAPQTLHDAWPVCGTRNFVSVRLYSAPQSHWTIVAILGICAFGEPVQAGLFAAIKSDRFRTRVLSADEGFRGCLSLAAFRTWRDVRLESAFGGKAEVGLRGCQVSF
jgi:hypothetical protein